LRIGQFPSGVRVPSSHDLHSLILPQIIKGEVRLAVEETVDGLRVVFGDGEDHFDARGQNFGNPRSGAVLEGILEESIEAIYVNGEVVLHFS